MNGYTICSQYAFLNKRRLAECERVTTRLIQLNSQQPEYPFILSGALWGQGKFKESYAAIMQCRKLRDSGKRCDWPIEEKLSNLDVALDISANFEDLRVTDYPQADTKQLLLISEICETCNQFELALGFQDAGLSRAGEDWQRSVKVHHFLAYFVDRLLRRDDLSNDICNKALEKSLKWLNWQIEYASGRTRRRFTHRRAERTDKDSQSARDLEVLFGATNDSRIAPELHEQLKEALARIEKLPAP